jgi:autophagy-related protein 18
VVALAFSLDGTLLAVASEQGTVVRIFTVPDARQVCALRRGSRPCHIYCLAFNAHATLLAVSGSTRTVHVFDLEKARLNFQSRMADEYPQQEKSLASKVAFLGRHSFSSLMTKRMHDFVDCDRSFAHARLRSAEPGAGSSRHPTLCALIPSPESSSDILLVVDCGVIFTYVVNHADGGDCRLASASSLLDADEL